MVFFLQSYERRGRVAKKGTEASLWADVTPEMMSEEELDEGVYVRHQPSYRSEALQRFINKLDARLDAEKGTHPRLERRLGSPHVKSAPVVTNSWVIKRDSENDDNGHNEQTGINSDVDTSSSEIL